MITQTLEARTIDLLRDFSDLVPAIRDNFHPLPIRILDRRENACKNYLSANRREFYKVMMVAGGTGLMTIGRNSYYIDKPTILFLHPADIITWRRLSDDHSGYVCMFKRQLIDKHPSLKATMDKYPLFADKSQQVISLQPEHVAVLNHLFVRMHEEELSRNSFNEDAIQHYLQLLMIECARITNFATPEHTSDEYGHVHEFFRLLEEETSHINSDAPISLKTAKEFAASLSVHPNYLNLLLKKHTGQNVSTHIRNRLVEEAKTLLLQTTWAIQDIGYSLGFAEQSNFNLFFKKNTGFTPAKFRKDNQLVALPG